MDLLEQLRQRCQSAQTATDDGAGIKDFAPLPPVAAETISVVEALLGFRLPPLLVDIYTKVANGGVGPGYGLFRLHDTPKTGDLVETYRYIKGTDPKWKWPDGLLPVFSHGCGMYECLDCRSDDSPSDDAPVIWHNPDHLRGRSVSSTLAPLAPSLRQRLVAWLGNENLIAAANEWLLRRVKK